MGQKQVEIAPGDLVRIGLIGKFAFLGKSVAVQPIDQTFAPAGDHSCLRIMRMGIDKAGHDERVAMVVMRHIGMGR